MYSNSTAPVAAAEAPHINLSSLAKLTRWLMGSQMTAGSSTAGSTTAGSTTAGSAAAGSAAVGSTTLAGSTTAGSAATTCNTAQPTHQPLQVSKPKEAASPATCGVSAAPAATAAVPAATTAESFCGKAAAEDAASSSNKSHKVQHDDDDDESLCVVCLAERRRVALVHGVDAHLVSAQEQFEQKKTRQNGCEFSRCSAKLFVCNATWVTDQADSSIDDK
jgi:hypothetical protein